MYFQRRTLGDKKINQSKNRFLPAIERLESRDTPSTLVSYGPFTNAGTLLSAPSGFTEVLGSVFYSATDASRGAELVKQTGSAISVYDIASGNAGSSPSQLLNAGNNLYFVADQGTGKQLFTFVNNAPMVVPGSPTNVSKIVGLGRDVFLITSDGNGLYRTLINTTDKTISVVPVDEITVTPSNAISFDNLTGLSSGSSSLWITRTAGGTAKLYNFAMGPDDQSTAQFYVKDTGLAGASAVSDISLAGPKIYFNATVSGQKKLQVYDGVTTTSLLPANVVSVGPARLINSTVYFGATQNNITKLWKSNGTTSSTTVSAVDPRWVEVDATFGLQSSAVVGDTLYYPAKTVQGVEPAFATFNLSGTIAKQGYFNLATGSVGTSPASQVERDSNPANFTVANQRVFFTASIPTSVTTTRNDLWTTDGTDAGTFLVNPPTGVTNTGSPTNVTGIGNAVYYGANNGKGQQPFNLNMVNTYSAGLVTATVVPTAGSLVAMNNKTYFISGTNIYQSNGTTTGTTLVSTGASGSQLIAYEGYLYFFRSGSLWRSNGTAGQVSGSPTGLGSGLFQGVFANKLWFSNNEDLYSYNGAITGPPAFQKVANNFLNSPLGITNAGAPIGELNGTVFYAGNDGIWSLDPQSSTPRQVATTSAAHSLQATANGILYLDGTSTLGLTNGTTSNDYTPNAGSSLVGVTTPTPLGGTNLLFTEQNASQINQIKLTNGLSNSQPTSITGFTANQSDVGLQSSTGYGSTKDGVYLSLTNANAGSEPWLINPAGQASLVSNLNPLGDSNPNQFKAGAGSVVYFSATDGINGTEVYRYDPNQKDSKTKLPLPPIMTTDVNPTGDSNPDSLTPSGNSLFWRAQPTVGNSMLYAELAAPLTPTIRSIIRLQPTTESVSTIAGTTQVTFQVLFNYSVDPTSVTKEDFVLSKSSTLKTGTIDTVVQVAGTNQYNVIVSLTGTAPGFGEIRVDESSNAEFLNAGLPVDRFGGFTAGEFYSVNPQSPIVTSLNRFDPLTAAPVNSSVLTYLINFSTGIDPQSLNSDDFTITSGFGSNFVNPRVSSISQAMGSFSQFYVQVTVDGGQGTLQANVKDGATIISLENQPYRQAGFQGQVYTVDLQNPYLAKVLRLSPTDQDTNATQVTFEVTFTEPMVQSSISSANTFLAVADQGLPTQSYASIQSVTVVNASTYAVRVAGLPLSGNLALVVNPNNTALDLAGNYAIPNPVQSPPNPNEKYSLSRQGPSVTSVEITDPDPTDPTTTTVTYRVNFNKQLDDASINVADFSLNSIAPGNVTGVVSKVEVFEDNTDPATPYSYVLVTYNQLGGNGEFSLAIPTNASILDLNGNPLSTPYFSSVTYEITDNVRPYLLTPGFEKVIPLGSVATDGVAVIRLMFSEGVVGLTNDLLPTTTTGTLAYSSMSIAPANANGSEWDVTYLEITGSGALTIGLINSSNIQDSAGNPLAGVPGTLVGSFTTSLTRQSLVPVTFSLSTIGSTPIVEIREPGGNTRNLQPFDSAFQGGIRSATGDYNGDGVEDIIVTAAQGGSGHVVVYDGVTFNVLASFYSFPGYEGSVNISAGDIEGDGRAEVVVAVASQGPSHVKAFGTDVYKPNVSFIAYPGYFGGVTVAAGDVTGDGKAEIITGTMGGTTPHVIVFEVTSGIANSLYSFYAFDPLYAGAVNVAAADLDGDSKAEIITGSGPGAASTIVVFKIKPDGKADVLRSFFPFGGTYLGGVSVGSGDWENTGRTDVLAGAQSGPMPTVQVYNGVTWGLIDELFAFNGALEGGVAIG